eukprot:m.26940 g.26940  ORF g.26940 m.26940 type:complete len:929 (-) comp9307_c2_seq4:577-3363(-)
MEEVVETFQALYDFVAEEDDELDLKEGDLIDVTIVHEGEWGSGTSRRTQKHGTFPWSYVEQFKDFSQHKKHNFQAVTVTVPTIDWHTRAFIWGAGIGGEAFQCTDCGFTCHKRSKFFVENNSALECVPNRNYIQLSSRAIDEWTVEDVHLFMVATKLDDYAGNFLGKSIDGKKLKALNHKRLEAMGIKDTQHRKMILTCIEEAIGVSSASAQTTFQERCGIGRVEGYDSVQTMDLVPFQHPSDAIVVVKSHRFKKKSYASMTWCDSSLKPLFGLVSQGYQCTACGFNVAQQYMYQVPSCRAPSLTITGNPPQILDNVFGVPLEGYLEHSEVPSIVKKCVEAINSNLNSKAADKFYESCGDFGPVRSLQAEIRNSNDIDLSKAKVAVVGALLKRFFSELPEPLIPYDLYDRFIAAASLPTEQEKVDELNRIIPLLPPQRKAVLEYLITHLVNVAGASKVKMNGEKLAESWAHVLLQPTDLFKAKSASEFKDIITAVRLLVDKCDIGGLPPEPKKAQSSSKKGATNSAIYQSNYEPVNIPRMNRQTRKPKPLPPRNPSKAPPLVARAMQQANALASEPWYAPGFNRARAEQTLSTLVDGSFLIRDSQSRKGFTLSIKFSEIRHIVIVQSDGKYGFSEPPTFESIPALVNHFTGVSLSYYNAELETTLAYPYLTAPLDDADDTAVFDDENEALYVSNVSALRESLARQHHDFRHERGVQRAAHLDKKIKDLDRSLNAQQAISDMFREALELNRKRASIYGTDSERNVLESHYATMQTMLEDSEKREKGIIHDMEETSREARLVERSENENASRAVVKDQPDFQRPQAAVLPLERAPYYAGNVDRERAKRILAGKKQGSYLVRAKAGAPATPFTLDVVFDGSVRHIKVLFEDGLYGLARPVAFETLDGLCQFYQKEVISSTIKTRLIFPVNK